MSGVPSRLQLWTLRNLCAYAALPCTAYELATDAKHSLVHTEQYLEKLEAGQLVTRTRASAGDLWEPTADGFRVASASAKAET